MKTLQEHYNAIKTGQGNKAQFVKQARNLFPEYFNQYTNYDNAVSVLKSKQIISEAAGGVVSKGFDIWDWKKILEAKAVETETSKEVLDDQKNAYNNKDMKNADNVNFNEIMKGFYCEMKDPANKDKTGDELKAMVVKNLAKDPLYYTKDGMFGVKGVGFTDEAPGLGKNTQPTSKVASVLGGRDEVDSNSDIVKNSLVGTTKKVKLKESVMYGDSDGDYDSDMESTIKANEYYDKGLEAYSEGDMLKAEKYYQAALKAGSWLGWTEQDLPPYNTLKENKETSDEKIARYEGYTYTLNGKKVKPEIAFYDNILKAELDGEIYRIGEPVNSKIELNPIKGKTGMYTESINEASISFSILNDDFLKDVYIDKTKNKIYISPKLAQSLESSFFSRGPASYERTKSNLDKAKTTYIKIDSGFRGILRKGLKGANITELPKKNSDGTVKWVSLNFPEKDYDIKITDEKITINKKQPVAESKISEGIEEYNDMSDQEIINWAEEDGMEELIVLDGEGGLANREEVLRALLGIEDLGSEESEEEMWGPDDIDPAGGYGPSSHMESVAEQKLRSLIRNLIKEELNIINESIDIKDLEDGEKYSISGKEGIYKYGGKEDGKHIFYPEKSFRQPNSKLKLTDDQVEKMISTTLKHKAK